ncbi:MAG: ATP-binding cassette domain-containing protein [Desulfomonilaceae bacterium]
MKVSWNGGSGEGPSFKKGPSPRAHSAVDVRLIEKFYPSVWGKPPVHALKGIDLTISSGAIFCILGPNAAGKTTLIAILAGLLYPDAGSGRVLGLDLIKQRRKIRAEVNFAGGHANLPDNFTVRETLNYFGMLYGLPKKERVRVAEELTSFFDLERYWDVPFNQLSTGFKQRLALAKSLINAPKILFLDEPTSGVDPAVARLIRSRLVRWQRESGATIILTTHQMDEAEQLSDNIAFLKEGRIIRIGRAEDLKNSVPFQKRLIIQGRNLGQMAGVVAGLSGYTLIEANDEQMICRIEPGMEDLNSLLAATLAVGVIIGSVEVTSPTLGDAFLELANRSHSD